MFRRNHFVFFCCFFLFLLPISHAQTAPSPEPTKAGSPAKATTPKAPPANVKTDATDDITTTSITAPAPNKPSKLKTSDMPTTPAAKFDDVFQSLDYPELQVIPSASERLRLQASEESRSGLYSYWPVQVSSLTLLTASIMSSSYHQDNITDSEREDSKRAKNIGIAVGSSWLLGTAILSFSRPYRTGFKKVSEFPTNSRADRLRRERLAEEQLQYPGQVASKLKYLAVGTNFLSSVALIPNKDNSGQIVMGVSALMSFLPLIFDTTYESTWEKHQEYKRRIYVPLVGVNSYQVPLSYDSRVARRDELTLTWSF